MRWNNFLLVGLLLGFTTTVWGQHVKVLHNSFQLDSLKMLSVDFLGTYEVEPWAGDAVLVETTIKLYDASSGILEYLIENERYKIDADTIDETGLHLFSVKKERKIVRTSKGESREEVKVRVFLPDTFNQVGDHSWEAPEEEEEEKQTSSAEPLPPEELPVDTTLQKKIE
ncbi:MAG: hypothetical protein AAF798_02360 [Bacteroidota bacterium]